MRQSLPHRNNIHSELMKCKGFVRGAADLAPYATFLPQRFSGANMSPQKLHLPNNGLDVSFLSLRMFPPQTDMAGMCLWHDSDFNLARSAGRRS